LVLRYLSEFYTHDLPDWGTHYCVAGKVNVTVNSEEPRKRSNYAAFTDDACCGQQA
jgi:hypothetical protein